MSNQFILIRQYRKAVGCHVTQLPGGGVEAGEDPEAAARREMFNAKRVFEGLGASVVT